MADESICGALVADIVVKNRISAEFKKCQEAKVSYEELITRRLKTNACVDTTHISVA